MARLPDKRLVKSLMVIGAVIEARDHYTGGHSWRLSQMARLLARQAGLSSAGVLGATVGAWLHDLGKVAVPDAILLKPGPLDAAERTAIRQHPRIGRAILADHPAAGLVIDPVAHHHERWDGTGYPDGLAGEDIPLTARLVAVVDVFDALTSVRPYRTPLKVEAALEALRADAGHHFDGRFVDLLEAASRRGELDDVVGHHDFGRPLVLCPQCGPVMAPPRSVRSGDLYTCRACLGVYRLEAAGVTFHAATTTLEPDTRPPQPDVEQIDDVLARV